jgi:hypothetical protein
MVSAPSSSGATEDDGAIVVAGLVVVDGAVVVGLVVVGLVELVVLLGLVVLVELVVAVLVDVAALVVGAPIVFVDTVEFGAALSLGRDPPGFVTGPTAVVGDDDAPMTLPSSVSTELSEPQPATTTTTTTTHHHQLQQGCHSERYRRPTTPIQMQLRLRPQRIRHRHGGFRLPFPRSSWLPIVDTRGRSRSEWHRNVVDPLLDAGDPASW